MANEDLNIANNAINNARGKMINNEFRRDRSNIVSSVAGEVAKMFMPLIKEVKEASRVDKQDLLEALSQITVEGTPSTVNVPEIKIPEIKVPEARVHVSVPPIRVPDVIMPDEMNIRGFVSLMGVSLENPLPVQLRNADGSPVSFDNLGGGQVVGGGSSGGARIVKVSNLDEINITSSGGLTDTELRAAHLDVQQVSGAISSVNVVDAFGSTAVTGLINPDNRIRVSVETGGSGLTDSELRASHLDVKQLSGAISSVNVVSTVALTDTELRASAIDVDGSGVTQPVSGAFFQATQPVSAAALPLPTGAATSANQQTDALTDSELRASTLDVKQVSGAISSVSVTNTPTVRPIQVRGSLATAYASISTGTETSLLAGVASEFHDMIWMKGANQSDVAVTLDIRGSVAGTVIDTLVIPANSTAGISATVPYPQADLDASWTIQNIGTDVSGTDVDITALFSKEV